MRAARQVAEAGELGLAQRQLAGLAAASAAGGPRAGLAADLALWRAHLAAREDAKLGARALRPHPSSPCFGPWSRLMCARVVCQGAWQGARASGAARFSACGLYCGQACGQALLGSCEAPRMRARARPAPSGRA